MSIHEIFIHSIDFVLRRLSDTKLKLWTGESVQKRRKRSQSRSLVTKRKLLEVGIEAFAQRGYEGVGTRELAERAGVNLSAIRYHFGDKKGLYRAVIQHISDGIRERVLPFIEEVQIRARMPGTSREELITAFCHLITSFASQLLGSGIADNWARLITREQVSPTDAFPIMYGVFRLLIDAAAHLLARITGEEPESEEVRIAVMAVVGQALVFRTHRATVTRFIGWKTLGSREIEAVQSVIGSQCRAILPNLTTPQR
jgi:TetR/AcrR family transcriptional regulator, regulator of cefoperazone and chloramphenicol sensitivity